MSVCPTRVVAAQGSGETSEVRPVNGEAFAPRRGQFMGTCGANFLRRGTLTTAAAASMQIVKKCTLRKAKSRGRINASEASHRESFDDALDSQRACYQPAPSGRLFTIRFGCLQVAGPSHCSNSTVAD